MFTPVPNLCGESRRAFTLIELLVVVAIISILAGLIFPAITSMQRAARATQCLSNMRQIGVAMNAYAGDNRMHFPGPGATTQTAWINQIAPYLGEPVSNVSTGYRVYSNAYQMPIFHCPLTPLSSFQTADGQGNGYGCYGMNVDLFPASTTSGNQYWSVVSIPEIVQPAQTVLLAEKSWIGSAASSGPNLATSAPFPTNSSGVAANHRSDENPNNGPNGTANYLYCDCHVASLIVWSGTASFNPTIPK
jgi:prepilin-type N-terminal cleavage/methylation domain-containing protein/prepilin-type processing-associated H-X9-DG protein